MRVHRGAAPCAVALLLGACGEEPPPAPTYDLMLDAQGVVFAGSDGSRARFPFGTARAEVEQAAAAVYGAEAARRSAGSKCDAGPMAFTSYGPLQLGFQQEQLAGWTIRAGATAATEGSIAPGITRAQLEELTPIYTSPDPALPGEFRYGTPSGAIHGVLAGSGPQARVAALFSGTVCRSR
ncbi:hypothetical protein [Croceibacterium ferulae]|uniref:hypothetical protein n=1 Tax=Croceibacterium ferulae TaxID=1854641 RepID=UPI000EB0FEBD|nr:hypothetical protein [Croceibacterium ferulae]